MAQNSDLEIRSCLVWNTQKPSGNSSIRESSTFVLLDIEWNLHMIYSYNYTNNFYMAGCEATNCTISLRKRDKTKNLKRSLLITIFIEDTQCSNFPKYGCTKNFQNTDEVLWQFPKGSIPVFNSSNELKIVCLFHGVSSSQVKNGAINLSTHCDVPGSVKLPPNLENLSLHLSKLLKNKAFPDIELRCGDHTIHAHKAVLAARSEVFAAMFRNKMSEKKTGVVDIVDLDVKVLELFLEYVYSGEVSGLPLDMVPSLYAASDRYAVHALKKACSEQMIKSLSNENCVSTLTVADAHGDNPFKEQVISFICEHQEVLESAAWLKFSEKPSKLAIEVYQSYVRYNRKK